MVLSLLKGTSIDWGKSVYKLPLAFTPKWCGSIGIQKQVPQSRLRGKSGLGHRTWHSRNSRLMHHLAVHDFYSSSKSYTSSSISPVHLSAWQKPTPIRTNTVTKKILLLVTIIYHLHAKWDWNITLTVEILKHTWSLQLLWANHCLAPFVWLVWVGLITSFSLVALFSSCQTSFLNLDISSI